MRASTAYFVGAGTIVVAIAIGLGGGIVAGNIMNPITPKQGPDAGKMAQRTEAAAKLATADASSERVKYVTGSQTFGALVAAPVQARDAVKPETPTTSDARAEPAAPQPAQAAAMELPKPASAAPQPAARPALQQASTESPASAPENAYAKAKSSDVNADVKRTASERRRIERRERWAERRRFEPRDQRGARDRTDWDDIARNVREDSDARDLPGRSRGPRIMLFGSEDD